MKTILVAAALSAQLSTELPTGKALEELYWDCDYASTQTLIGGSEAAVCSAAYEKFRAERFKSFDEFMKYWQENKAREHKARAK